MESSKHRASFKDLPLELIQEVISLMGGHQTPSSEFLHQEPSIDMNRSEKQDIKNLSRTCHCVRTATLPYLFKFITIAVELEKLFQESRIEPLTRLLSDRGHITLAGVTVRFVFDDASLDKRLLPDDCVHKYCSGITDAFQPESLTIVCSRTLLSYLLPSSKDIAEERDDGWAFDMLLHVLRLLRPPGDRRMRKSNVWDESWTAVTLNEGSSPKVYSTYEYFLKRTPSIFWLEHFNKNVLQSAWTGTVREFNYVAIFPLSTHTSHVFNLLLSLHNLRIIKARILPLESSSILLDSDRVGKCSLSDLWIEVGENYDSIASFVRYMNEHHFLEEFTPLDVAQTNIAPIIYPKMTLYLQDWERHGIRWLKNASTVDLDPVPLMTHKHSDSN